MDSREIATLMVELSQNAVSKSSEKTILEPVGYLNKFPSGGIHAGFHPVSSRRFLSSDLDCPLFKALFVLNISSPLSTSAEAFDVSSLSQKSAQYLGLSCR